MQRGLWLCLVRSTGHNGKRAGSKWVLFVNGEDEWRRKRWGCWSCEWCDGFFYFFYKWVQVVIVENTSQVYFSEWIVEISFYLLCFLMLVPINKLLCILQNSTMKRKTSLLRCTPYVWRNVGVIILIHCCKIRIYQCLSWCHILIDFGCYWLKTPSSHLLVLQM